MSKISKDKYNYTNNIGRFFKIVLFIIIFVCIIEVYIMPEETDDFFVVNDTYKETDMKSLIYTGDFYRILEDGTREAIVVPGRYPVSRWEALALESVIPADFSANVIAIRSVHENIKIYVDYELRVNYDTSSTRPVGFHSPNRFVICPASAKDAGKTLRIEITSGAKNYTGKVNTVYAGDRYDFWNFLLKKYGLKVLVAFVVVIIGVLIAGIGFILRIGFKHPFSIEYLGWLIIVTGGWQLTTSEIKQLFVPNVTMISHLEYIFVMFVTIPFALYMNDIQKFRYKRYYNIIVSVAFVNSLTQIALQTMNIADYVDLLLISHIILGSAILFVVITFVIDMWNGKIREYIILCLSMLIFMLCAVIACGAIYFTNANPNIIVAVGVIQYVVVAIFQTTTDVKLIEETRRKEKEEKLEADNANRAKSQFLANMSHEIRTPINAVLGMNTMILRKTKDSEIRKYANDIQNAGRNLLSIINDILDFSKIESGKMELVPVEYDFFSLINDVYNMIATKARDKDLNFVLEIDETIPCRLYGDDVRIRQILVNLLTNAVKYTPSGTVTLAIRKKENSVDNEAMLHFSVKDTGIGIKTEDISKLTEEFVRIEESRNRNIEGTGLGINIVMSLLALMESKLEVYSVYGEGSDFYFDLLQPIRKNEAIGSVNEKINKDYLKEDDYSASFCIPDARLLVVDDNAMNLSVFSSLLSDLLCQIDEADSGVKCLELVKEHKYDIIFMDHMMPVMDGIETFHHMKEYGDYINADTPVVILTANAVSGAKEAYLAEGFTDYLSKPIDADKLEEMIGRLVLAEKKKPARKKAQAAGMLPDIELPYIDGVDWQHAIIKLKTEALLLDSIKNFSNMASMDIKILKEMYAKLKDTNSQGVFDEYRIKVHSMKSNVATIGADHLAGVAKYLEYAAKEYDNQTIDNLMPLFEKEWNRLKVEIDEAFGYNHRKDENVRKEKKIEIAELELLFEVLKEAMDASDLDRADAVVEELSEYCYPEEQMDLLEEIKMAVLNIDTEQLDHIIQKWNKLIK